MPKKTTNPVEEPKETEAPVQEAKSTVKIDAQITKQMDSVKKHLDAQPKVAFYVPLTEGESDGAFETVQINGYTMQIQKGVSMELPQQVAEMLANKYRVQSEAGKAMLANRDEKVQDALT